MTLFLLRQLTLNLYTHVEAAIACLSRVRSHGFISLSFLGYLFLKHLVVLVLSVIFLRFFLSFKLSVGVQTLEVISMTKKKM